MSTTNLMQAHEQWRTRPEDQRFETLEDLSAAVNNRRRISRQGVVELSHAKVMPRDNGIVIDVDGRTLEPTHWSFGQLAARTSSPAGFLRQLTPETVSTVLNERLELISRTKDDSTAKLLRLEEDDGTILQAVTSAKYGRIWDSEAVDLVRNIVDRSDGRFHNPLARTPNGDRPSGLYASDRDVFMFMIDGGSLLEAGPRAQLNKGFFVWNSEVGSATFGVTTFLFNVVCGNHIVWGARDVNTKIIRHTSGGPQRFMEEAAPSLLAHVAETPDLTAIEQAQRIRLVELSFSGAGKGKPTDADWQNSFANWRNFTRSEVREAVETAIREEGKIDTLWDLIMGMTAVARDVPHIDTRIDLEKRAGKLIELAS